MERIGNKKFISGERGGGEICVNGAAAHLVSPGDLVILIAYSQMSDAEARTYVPKCAFGHEDAMPVSFYLREHWLITIT